MSDKNNKKDSFPLWQKILYGVLAFIVLLLILLSADKIGLIEFLAGANI